MATATASRRNGSKTRKKKAAKPLSLKNMIDGKFVAPRTGRREKVVTPATEQVIASAPLSEKADVDAAVAAARKAFETWGLTTPGERQGRLAALADAIEDRADDIADLEAPDAGKTRAGGRGAESP